MTRQTTARIDLGALQHNLDRIKTLAPGSRVMAVVKADAYGHGLERVLPALAKTDAFAVATVGEATRVREAGWSGRLVLLEGFSDAVELEAAFALEAEAVVHHENQMELLRKAGRRFNHRLWLKIDTGMHRLGFPAAQSEAIYAELESFSGPDGIGLMSHFACADEIDNPMTRQQLERFHDAVRHLDGPRSLANSAALLNFPEAHQDWIRPGLALYGVSPVPGALGSEWDLQPAMTLSCQVIAVNQCQKGDTIGYGAAYTCPENMPVGIAAIGYGDGYPLHTPHGTPVLVGSNRAVLAGRVSMDMINIDLRTAPGVRVGDPVTLWGEGMPIEDVARACNTLPYELICGVTSRVDYFSSGSVL